VLALIGIERVPVRAPRIHLVRAGAKADAVLNAAAATIARSLTADGADLATGGR
jgi:hypothetical protein